MSHLRTFVRTYSQHRSFQHQFFLTPCIFLSASFILHTLHYISSSPLLHRLFEHSCLWFLVLYAFRCSKTSETLNNKKTSREHHCHILFQYYFAKYFLVRDLLTKWMYFGTQHSVIGHEEQTQTSKICVKSRKSYNFIATNLIDFGDTHFCITTDHVCFFGIAGAIVSLEILIHRKMIDDIAAYGDAVSQCIEKK